MVPVVQPLAPELWPPYEERARRIAAKGIEWSAGAELVEVHKALIGGMTEKWYCSTCATKLRKMYYDLKFKYYEKTMAKAGKYSFKNEKTSIRPFGMAEYVDAETLTDEKAEEMIKIDPAYAQLFNVDESFQSTTNQETAPLKVKADFQARYAELYGQQPDDKLTIEELKAKIAEKEGSN